MKVSLATTLGSLSLLALSAQASQLRFPSAQQQQPITSFSSRPSRVLSHHDNPSLASLKGHEDFTVLQHEQFPNHSVRIKETTSWCDPNTESFTGYLDVGNGKELFFYYFASRSKPDEDPLMMWINGGPGCSSSMALFAELGPCSLQDNSGNITTKENPFSWTEKANVFFLDEPIGVGFSYAEHGQIVGRAEDAALDVQAFIAIFIETFKEFKGRPVHLAGESYGGRYLPIFAAAVVDGNKALVEAGGTAINLKSVAIGNGVTDPFSTPRGYFEHTCTTAPGLDKPILSVGQCQAMAVALPRCEALMKAECLDRFDLLGCQNAMSFCGQHISEPFFAAELNPYDVSLSCTLEELSDSLCYPKIKVIRRYLDQPHIRNLLGVNKDLGPFESCSSSVGAAFHLANDGLGKTYYYVAALLEHGIDVLLYVGKLDWICNHRSNLLWSNALEWTHGEEFRKAELKDWHVNGRIAGQVKKAKNLTFMTVDKAGHMVPMDQPEAALQMINRWLQGKEQ